MKVSYNEIAAVARHGSPLALRALGRLYGLSQDDLQSLRGGVPFWTVAILAGAAGVFAGVRLDRAYGHKLPRWLTGR